MRKKMASTVEQKSMNAQMENQDEAIEQITGYLEMMDMIDSCLQEYRVRYNQFKEFKIEQIQIQRIQLEERENQKAQPSQEPKPDTKVEKKIEDKKPKKLDDSSSDDEEEVKAP